jgi:hypothetical protein
MNVSDQNFRRELTAVFVEMSEKISPALRDRVPASIAQARRERGGPYWIGALGSLRHPCSESNQALRRRTTSRRTSAIRSKFASNGQRLSPWLE